MTDHGNDIRSAVYALRAAVSRKLEQQATPLRDRREALALELPAPVDEAAFIARLAAGDEDAAEQLLAAEIAFDHCSRIAQVHELAQSNLTAQIREVMQSEDRQLAHVESNAEAALRVANQIATIRLQGRDPGVIQATLDATAGTAIKTAQQLGEKYGCTAEAEQLAADLRALLSATSQVRRIA